MDNCKRCWNDLLKRSVGEITDKDGSVILCPDCGGGEARLDRIALYSAVCGLDNQQLTLTLSGMEKTAQVVGDMINACVKLLRGEIYFVTLFGQAGAGKTHAAMATVASVVQGRGDLTPTKAIFQNVVELLDILRAGYGDPSYRFYRQENEFTPDEWQDELVHVPLLVLNDLDKAKGLEAGQWAYEKLFNLIDQRYMAAESRKRSTIITLNTDPDDIFDEALASRLTGNHAEVVRLTGQGLNYRRREHVP